MFSSFDALLLLLNLLRLLLLLTLFIRFAAAAAAAAAAVVVNHDFHNTIILGEHVTCTSPSTIVLQLFFFFGSMSPLT